MIKKKKNTLFIYLFIFEFYGEIKQIHVCCKKEMRNKLVRERRFFVRGRLG